MRFTDNIDGWQNQLAMIKADRNLMNFISAISSHEIEIVKVQDYGLGNNHTSFMCHKNVSDIVADFGGTQVYGWILRHWNIYNTSEFDGMFMAVFHSNWLTPEGQLVSVTPEDTEFQLFLPDTRRKFDIATNTSFNNRAVYTDQYRAPSFAFNPCRNVNYFMSGQYADRGRNFEKYRIPNSVDDVINSVPETMKRIIGNKLYLSDEGKRWASLNFSITLG